MLQPGSAGLGTAAALVGAPVATPMDRAAAGAGAFSGCPASPRTQPLVGQLGVEQPGPPPFTPEAGKNPEALGPRWT